MPLLDSLLDSLAQAAPEQTGAAVVLVTMDSASSASSASVAAEGRDCSGMMQDRTRCCLVQNIEQMQAPPTVSSQHAAAAGMRREALVQRGGSDSTGRTLSFGIGHPGSELTARSIDCAPHAAVSSRCGSGKLAPFTL